MTTRSAPRVHPIVRRSAATDLPAALARGRELEHRPPLVAVGHVSRRADPSLGGKSRRQGETFLE